MIHLGTAKGGVVLDVARRRIDAKHLDVGRRFDGKRQLVAIQVGVVGQGVIEFDRLRIRHACRHQERLVGGQQLGHGPSAQAAQSIEHGHRGCRRRRRCRRSRRSRRRRSDQGRQLDRDAGGLRGVAQARVGAALRNGFQGNDGCAWRTLDRQRDAHVLAIGFNFAEIFVGFDLACRHRRCAQGGAAYLEFELVAIHVIAIGNLPACFQRIGVECPGRELECKFGVDKFLRVSDWNLYERPPKYQQCAQQTNPFIHVVQSPWSATRGKRADRVLSVWQSVRVHRKDAGCGQVLQFAHSGLRWS